MKASNSVDSYEKIISLSCESHREITSALSVADQRSIVSSSLVPNDVFAGIETAIVASSCDDSDVMEFVRFYSKRLDEELGRAGSDPMRVEKIRNDFLPRIYAECVGLYGTSCQAVRVSVDIKIGGEGPFCVEIEGVPELAIILSQPDRKPCDVTGRIVPAPCLGQCVVSKKSVLRTRLERSDFSERLALPEYIETCCETGKKGVIDEMIASDVSGKAAHHSVISTSEVSGRFGLSIETAKCEFSGCTALIDEIAVSEISGKKFRVDQKEVCSVTGKIGHKSEFVVCCVTGAPLLPSEAAESDYSHKVVRKDFLRKSEKPPFRTGTDDEFGVCSESGMRLLKDELVASAVSGFLVDREKLVKSGVSEKFALPREMVVCEVSGIYILPNEAGVCMASGKRVDKRLLGKSAVSGKVALIELLRPSQVSSQNALPDELVRCTESGIEMLPSEAGVCQITGKNVDRRLLCKSEFSGKLCLGRLLQRSAVSGISALPDELIVCEESRIQLLPYEAGVCSISSKRVDKRLLGFSDISKRSGLKTLLFRCDKTGFVVLPDEIGTCSVSGRKAIFRELGKCCVSKKLACREFMAVSDVTGKYLLPEFGIRSLRKDKICEPTEATPCTWTGELLFPSDAVACKICGLKFKPGLINKNGQFVVLKELLDGKDPGEQSSALQERLRRIGGDELRDLKEVRCISGPNGNVVAVCGYLRAWLGLKSRYVGLMVEGVEKGGILGKFSFGQRKGGNYWLQDEAEGTYVKGG